MEQVRRAVVLVGGKGTRLSSVVKSVPKPLAPIAGRPFLDHLLCDLARQGIARIILAVGYMADHFLPYQERAAEFGFEEILISKEESPLGTGGALSLLRSKISRGEVFLLVNGDTFFQGDLKDFLCFDVGEAKAHLGLCHVDDLSRFGSVRLGLDGFVEEFLEKQPGASGFVSAGLYLLSSDIFEFIPEGECISLEVDIFPKLVEKRYVSAEYLVGSFFDIGIPDSYFSFHVDLVLQEASERFGVGFSHLLLTWMECGRVLAQPGFFQDSIKEVIEQRAYLKEIVFEIEKHAKHLRKNDVFVVPKGCSSEQLKALPAKLIGFGSDYGVDGNIIRELDFEAIKYFDLLRDFTDRGYSYGRSATPFLFLDRDGVVIEYVPYISSPDKVRLKSGIVDLIGRFRAAGYRVVIVTNQSGVGRELYTQKQYQKVQERTLELLASHGHWVDATYFSDFIIHSKRAGSMLYPSMRKPRPAMIFEEMQFWNVDLSRSVMIGDNSSDVLWARNIGIHKKYYVQNEWVGRDLDDSSDVLRVDSLDEIVV